MARRRGSGPRRPVPKSRECLFCGSSGPLEKEHVFGDWLRKLGFSGEGWREITDESATPVSRIEQGGPFSKRLKIVCGPCNNEWMSSMEDGVKPLLVEMFNTVGKVKLDEPAQILFARWAFKTICVIDQLTPVRSKVPLAHCRELRRKDRPPRQTQIWIGTATGDPHPQGKQLVEAAILPREGTISMDGKSFRFNAYQARFRLINVVFDCFGYRFDRAMVEESVDGELGRALLPIWPPGHPALWWPPVQSIDALGGVAALSKVPMRGIPSLGPLPIAQVDGYLGLGESDSLVTA